MSENPLDVIRNKIREAEERLKNNAPEAVQNKPPFSNMRVAEPATATSFQNENALAAQEQNAKLQSLQKKLEIAFESSRDAILLVDGNRGWKAENRHLWEWLDYGEAEFSNLSLMDLFEPETANKLIDSFPQWLEGKTPLRQVPGCLRSNGGGQIPVLISSYAWFNECEELFAFIVLEDTRLQRKIESQVDHVKGFIRALTREGPIPTFVMDTAGAVVEANRAACEWLGIRPEEIAAIHLRNFVYPSCRDDFDRVFERALMPQPPVEASCRFYNNGGAGFRTRLYFIGVAGAPGTVDHIIGMLGPIAEQPPLDWSAYGRMMPGVLNELSSFIAEHIRDVLKQIRSHAKPDLKKFVKGINDSHFVLSRWVASAALLPDPLVQCTLADLVQQAMNSRKTEILRWGIDANFKYDAAAKEVRHWPPAIARAMLHIIQWCIEQLHDATGKRRLLIHALKLDERMEISFLCDSSGQPGSTHPIQTVSSSHESSCIKNFEFKAAQKLMDAAGGTVVLEIKGKTLQIIRINLSSSVLAADSKTQL